MSLDYHTELDVDHPDWIIVVNNFLDVKSDSGRPEKLNTLLSYKRILSQFISVVREHYNGVLPPFSELDHQIIPLFTREPVLASKSKNAKKRKDAVKAGEMMIPASKATNDRRLNVLSGFFDVAIFNRFMDINPAKMWRAMVPSGSSEDQRNKDSLCFDKALNEAECRAFFKCIAKVSLKEQTAWAADDPKRLRHERIRPAVIARNELIFYLFEATGIRIAGLTGMDIFSLDLDSMLVTVTEKREKKRTVPVLPGVIDVSEFRERVIQWLEVYRPILASHRSEKHMWLNHYGGKLGRRAIQTVCSEAMKKAKLSKPNFGPHLLRHTYATKKLDANKSPRDVARMLGHSGLGTIAVYDSGEMKEAIKRMKD